MALFSPLNAPEVSASKALIALVVRRCGVQFPEAASTSYPLAVQFNLPKVDWALGSAQASLLRKVP